MEFLAALAGALVGGFFSILATKAAHKDQLELQRQATQENAKAILYALSHEIRCVWTMYMAEMGKYVEEHPNENGYKIVFPVNANYFAVYDASAASLGLISEPKMRNQVIITYTLAKALIDTYTMNNQMVKGLGEAIGNQLILNNAATARVVQSNEQALGVYANQIRLFHGNCKQAMTALDALFVQQGIF